MKIVELRISKLCKTTLIYFSVLNIRILPNRTTGYLEIDEDRNIFIESRKLMSNYKMMSRNKTSNYFFNILPIKPSVPTFVKSEENHP